MKHSVLIIGVLLISALGSSYAPASKGSVDGPDTTARSYELSPEMKKLAVFVGDWVYEGEQVDSPMPDLFGEAGEFFGTIAARFVLDGSFLKTKWEDNNPAGTTTIIEMTRYDSTGKNYVANGYLSDGSRDTTVQTVSPDARIWTSKKTFTTSAGKEVLLKCVLTFSPDWRSYTSAEEYSVDGGKTWVHWYKFEANKVRTSIEGIETRAEPKIVRNKAAAKHISSNVPAFAAGGGEEQGRLPIIDMHVHAFGEDGYDPEGVMAGLAASESPEMLFRETYDQFRKWNVVKAVVSGPLECVETWKAKDEDDRIIRGVLLSGPNDDQLDPVRFEELIRNGKIDVYGEIVPPLSGTRISDAKWQPYLKICEQYDIPLAIHTGGAPPAVKGTWTAKSRLHLGDPYLIEDVVVNYPKLRIYMCHSGQEFHERALMLMLYYPRVYSDLGYVLWGDPTTKRYAREFLAKAKEAGCLKQVMFGSDQMYWPRAIEMSIDYLNTLEFLTEEDKRDILYNNAARFLKLKE